MYLATNRYVGREKDTSTYKKEDFLKLSNPYSAKETSFNLKVVNPETPKPNSNIDYNLDILQSIQAYKEEILNMTEMYDRIKNYVDDVLENQVPKIQENFKKLSE